MSDEPVLVARVNSGTRLLIWQNRYEVETRRALTLFLTKKREVYAFKTIRDVVVKGATIWIHFGPLSVRSYMIGRKKAAQFRDIWASSL